MVAQRKEATTLRQPSLELSTSPVFLVCQAVPTASWADPALRNCSRQKVGCMPTDHRELSRGHGVKWLCGLRTQAGQLLILDLAVSLSSWLLPESLSLDLPWVTGILLTQGPLPTLSGGRLYPPSGLTEFPP